MTIFLFILDQNKKLMAKTNAERQSKRRRLNPILAKEKKKKMLRSTEKKRREEYRKLSKDTKQKLMQKERLKKGEKKAKWRKETSNKINKTICYRQPYSTRSSLSRAANKVKKC